MEQLTNSPITSRVKSHFVSFFNTTRVSDLCGDVIEKSDIILTYNELKNHLCFIKFLDLGPKERLAPSNKLIETNVCGIKYD